MPAARRRGLVGLLQALARGELVIDAGADRAATRRQLLALPGVGPWTAEYIAMRALRDPDAFLASDLGVRHALERLGVDGRAASATALSERWRPYRAYAVQYLWAALARPPGAYGAQPAAQPADMRIWVPNRRLPARRGRRWAPSPG
jgi:AraC family transcriptional regulator of adaptative response / DNA-3-methyladenine glycosylase II